MKDKFDRTEINEFYKKALIELKRETGLKPKSLIEKVGLRNICECVLPQTKNPSEHDRLLREGTVETTVLFLEKFYGLKFSDHNDIYFYRDILEREINQEGYFEKYLSKVQEDSHLL